ncbi:tripartite motif-containing protein 10-like isoform X2 [Homarus americanus]|uniref:tripartite motif-containing protein 10-like isoform X2 n=1 Tax=Homarus americanus TaxID=6706 RepID=UPI001C47219D|nr:tripartite motif-containing protein 10-like isoform X2 [Homarus americanus]
MIGIMEEELTCAVCSDMYSSGLREPVALPLCGHTFCKQCLSSVETEGPVHCPTCRTQHHGASIAKLPTVFALLSLSETFNKTERGGCGDHGSPLEFWCRGCQEALCGHCLLEAHVRDGHHVEKAKIFIEERKMEIHAQGAQLVQKIRERKDTIVGNIINFIVQITQGAEESKILCSSTQKVEKIVKDAGNIFSIDSVLMSSTLMESLQGEILKHSAQRAEEITGAGKQRCKSCSETEATIGLPRQVSASEVEWQEIPLEETEQTTVHEDLGQGSSSDIPVDSKPKTSKEEAFMEGTISRSNSVQEDVTVEGVEKISVKNLRTPWPLHCSVVDGEGRTGRLRWERKRLHLYALTKNLTEAHLLVQMSLLQTLVSREKPEVFLDLGVENGSIGRVYIRLEGRLRRAQHFLALCLGSLGPSYQGSKFHGVAKRGAPGETLAGGKYITSEGTSVNGLMENLEWGGKYIKEKTEGLVVGASGGKPELDAFFHICTRENRGKKFACAFGEVVTGMEVVHAAVKHIAVKDVFIDNIGVVIPTLPL